MPDEVAAEAAEIGAELHGAAEPERLEVLRGLRLPDPERKRLMAIR